MATTLYAKRVTWRRVAVLAVMFCTESLTRSPERVEIADPGSHGDL